MEVITRDEAYAQGKRHFYLGKPCKRGHVALRFTANGTCCECQNRRQMPAASAPNVGVPPSGYAFHPTTQLSPGLISYVHARVLAHVDQFAAEYLAIRPGLQLSIHTPPASEAAAVLQAGEKLRTLAMLDGVQYGSFAAAGWTDQQMVDGGMAVWKYPHAKD